MKIIATCLVSIFAVHASAVVNLLTGPVINPANNHLYYLLAPASWTDSQTQALILGGNLVTINDAAENAWVYSTFGGMNRPLWLGLTDQAVEGTFTWVSGEPLSFVNWNTGEPNNGSGFVPNEDYVYMIEANPAWPQLSPGKWNDVPVDGEGIHKPVYGVVEVVPEPSIMAFGIGSLVALSWARRKQQQ
jgi:hypothetical protein